MRAATGQDGAMLNGRKTMSRGRLVIAGWLAVSALMVAAPAVGANSYPSVEQATFHELQFADADIAVFKNVYPAHSDSGFHLHPRELFYVVITPARFGAQKLGEPLKMPATAVAAGSTGYNVMTDAPFIHRVINEDDRPCHIVAIELRRAEPAGTVLTERPAAYAPIFDHRRMRAWRLILAPGQSVAAIAPSAKGVRVVVRGGDLVTSVPGVVDQTLAVEPGDVAIQPVGTNRALRNVGKTPIELVEIELK